MGYRTPGQKGPHQTEIPSTAVGWTRRVGTADFYPSSARQPRRIGDPGYGGGLPRNVEDGGRGLAGGDLFAIEKLYSEVGPALAALVQSAAALSSAVQQAQDKVRSLDPGVPQALAELSTIAQEADSLTAFSQGAQQKAAEIAKTYAVKEGGVTLGYGDAPRIDQAYDELANIASQVQAALSRTKAIKARISNLVQVATSTSQQQVQAAQRQQAAAQQQAATAQQQADQATVQRARSSSLSLMNAGNFDGASAALRTQAVVDAAGRLNLDLSADLDAIASAKARAAGTAEGAAAAKAADADRALVQQARSRSLALMAGENYNGALAVLQASDVMAAAGRVGFDLTGDLVAIATAQKQADARTTATTAQQRAEADCASAGGSWTGTRCDMSLAQARQAAASADEKVELALEKARTLAAAGSYRAAMMTLSGVGRAARTAGREDDVSLLVAQIKVEQDAAACASRGGQWDGNYCAMPVAPPPQAPSMEAPAPPPPDPQTECIRAGGQWDGEKCAMPPPSWLAQLLPTLFAAPPAAPGPAAPGLAPVTQGPSMQQLQAIAILRAFGGAQGATLADALAGAMAPQGGTDVSSAPPDGTPCAIGTGRRRTPGIYQGGECTTVPPPSGFLRGAPSRESF